MGADFKYSADLLCPENMKSGYTLRDDTDFDDVFSGESPIRNGDQGPVVEKLQRGLLAVGYELPRFGADGHFGAETESVVRAFQRDSGLRVDGVVGSNSMAVLDSLVRTVDSSYHDETEKNLGRIVDGVGNSSAILLFDGADALFGRRSEVEDSDDER